MMAFGYQNGMMIFANRCEMSRTLFDNPYLSSLDSLLEEIYLDRPVLNPFRKFVQKKVSQSLSLRERARQTDLLVVDSLRRGI